MKYLIIRNHSGLFCKYGELGTSNVKVGDTVEAGQLIGHVGSVLNSKMIARMLSNIYKS